MSVCVCESVHTHGGHRDEVMAIAKAGRGRVMGTRSI